MSFTQGDTLIIESLGTLGDISRYNTVVSESTDTLKVKNLSPNGPYWFDLSREMITYGLRDGDVRVKK